MGPDGGPIGWWLDSGNGTVYAQLASVLSPSELALNSTASDAFFKIWAAISWILFLFSLAIIFKMKKKALSWAGFVVLVEGIAANAARGVQNLYEPAFVHESSYWFSNFIQLVDVPMSISSTWVALMIWLKIVGTTVFAVRFNTKITYAWNAFVWLGVLVLFVILYIYICGKWSYALRPWTPELLAKGADEVRTETNNLIYNITIAFLATFAAICLAAIAAIIRVAKQTASVTIVKTIKRMMIWISLQMVGMMLFTVGFYYISEHLRHYAYVQSSFVIFFNHVKPFGSLLSSFAQVMAVNTSLNSTSSS